MPAQLLALSDGPSILLDKPILLLGRHPECDIQLNSRKVSRKHCCVAQVHDYLVVRDLGSTNGIRINGSRVLEGKLNAGDELTVGNFRYRVTWDEAEPVRAKPATKAVPPAEAGRKQPKRFTDADALLEDADEPVELDEEFSGPVPEGLPVARPLPPGPGGTVSDSPSAFVLPDNLTLLPNSGAIRKPGYEAD